MQSTANKANHVQHTACAWTSQASLARPCLRRYKAKMKIIYTVICLSLLSSCSLQIAKPAYEYKKNERAIYQGCTKHDGPIALDSFPLDVEIDGNLIGKIEARDGYRNLFYVSTEKGEVKAWSYLDYSCIEKISIDKESLSIKIYYKKSLVRDEYFVNVVNLESLKFKNVLLKRGQWRI